MNIQEYYLHCEKWNRNITGLGWAFGKKQNIKVTFKQDFHIHGLGFSI